MKKLKDLFLSENGMKIVNALFLISLLIRNRGIILIAHIVWIIYLSFCIRHASSGITKTVYKCFIAFACMVTAANIYFYITLT